MTLWDTNRTSPDRNGVISLGDVDESSLFTWIVSWGLFFLFFFPLQIIPPVHVAHQEHWLIDEAAVTRSSKLALFSRQSACSHSWRSQLKIKEIHLIKEWPLKRGQRRKNHLYLGSVELQRCIARPKTSSQSFMFDILIKGSLLRLPEKTVCPTLVKSVEGRCQYWITSKQGEEFVPSNTLWMIIFIQWTQLIKEENACDAVQGESFQKYWRSYT